MSVNQRINFLIETFADNVPARFAKAIGVAPTVIASYLPGGRESKPSFEVLEKIIHTFPQLRLEWLIKGEEPKFNHEGNLTQLRKAENETIDSHPLTITVDDHGNENIVLVNTKAQGGYPTMLQEPEFYKKLPTMKIPTTAYRNGTFRAFEVNKDSMSPTLHHGAIVIGRYEDGWEKGNIQEGYIYVVVTREHVVVKRVLNRLDRGELYMMSDNEAYEGYPEKAADVLQLWRVVGGIINKFPNTRYEWRRKMSHMEADLFELRQEVKEMRKRLTN